MTLSSGDASITPTEKSEPAAGALQTPGAMLVHERTRRGLSVQQAAEGLHLDAWIVEAIESNRFLALGAPVYAKGYLRKYAVMLGLAPEVIVARYDALTDTLPEPTPVPIITTTPPPRPKWPKYIAWAVIAALIAGIVASVLPFVWPSSEPATTSATQVGPASPTTAKENQPAPRAAEVAVAIPEASVPVNVAEPVRREIVPDPAPAQQASSAPVAASNAEAVRLTLSFSNASWAEVYAADGERLFYDIGQAGRARTVSGTPPLNVVLGVVDAVNVQVNDRDIIVPRRANRESARFVVNADGSVQ
jgi:cytoskeleton protein RodZ